MAAGHLLQAMAAGERGQDWGFPSGTARHVYLQVAFYASRDGVCRFTLREIATACGVSRITAQRTLADLKQAGLVTMADASHYRITPPRGSTNES